MAIYIDDRELVAAHQAGDSEAFDELVREHRSSLFSHARRKLACDDAAEDAVQETLVRAYRALPRFNGEYRLSPWLHRILANVCVDEANRRQRDGQKKDLLSAQPATRRNAPSADEELGLHLNHDELNSALDELAGPYRDALVLRFVDELGYEEVAAAAGVSEQNARARVSRARTAMKSIMKGVAALPIFVIGFLKKGEKAAAAATSTSVPVTAAAGSAATGTAVTAASQATTAVSASLPALTEATVAAAQAAPAAVPVIAKAAVGIGLAAAVLTPTSDSAVHQAVENFTAETAGVLIVETERVSGNEIVEAESASVTDPGETMTVVVETLSPSLDSNAQSESDISGGGLQGDLSVSQIAQGSAGVLGGESLLAVAAGRGQFELVGDLRLVVDSVAIQGSLEATSRLRMASEADADGRQRLDALLVVNMDNGSQAEVRLVGFVDTSDDAAQAGGLFKADVPGTDLAKQGSFAGTIDLVSGAGLLDISLTP